MSVPYPRVDRLADSDEPSDIDLIARVRAGSSDAYSLLYQRHLRSARGLAWQLSRSATDVDDLVADAFAKVFATLRAGGGPTTAFRAYLLTSIRNSSVEWHRRDRRLKLCGDMTEQDPAVPWVDPAVAGLESTLAARAFAQLPERWQAVLWHTEVEEDSPTDLAPILGLSPNAVAALAYRAREGLRQAYLREHLSAEAHGEHRQTVARLGAWTRGGLTRGRRAKVDEHLAECERCRALAAEVQEVNGGLRGLIAPAVLGTALAPAYLSSAAGKAAAAAGGVGAAAAAGGGGIGAVAAVGAGGAAAAGGSTLSAVVGWIAGTTAGKVAVGAAAAVVVAGTVVGAGVTGPAPAGQVAAGPSAVTPATGPAAASRNPEPTRPGAPASGGPSAQADRAPDPAASRPDASAAPLVPGRQAGVPPRQSGGRTSAVPPPGSGTGSKTPPPRPAPAAGGPVLEVGAPAAVRPLRQDRPGEIGVLLRNDGTGAAADLVATVSLPAGVTVRAGSSNSRTDWHCTGTGQVATCRIASLPAGSSGTVRVKVFVARDAISGVVDGEVSGAGVLSAVIPSAAVDVDAK